MAKKKYSFCVPCYITWYCKFLFVHVSGKLSKSWRDVAFGGVTISCSMTPGTKVLDAILQERGVSFPWHHAWSFVGEAKCVHGAK